MTLINMADVKETGRCAQCGKASIGSWIRVDGQDRVFHQEWCETHFPDVWTMLTREAKKARKAWWALKEREWALGIWGAE